MKKVLFVVTTLDVGGIETYLLRFLDFAGQEVEAMIFCKSGKGGALEEKYKNLNVEIIKYKLRYFPVLGSIKLYGLLKKEKFNTVCDFTGDFAGLPLSLARFANVPNRLSFYRGSMRRFKQDPFRMFYNKMVKKLVRKNATKILSNSQTALDYFHPDWQQNGEKFEVIRNGIPVELFEVDFDKSKLRKELEIPDDAFVIGHVGRFDTSKNHKTIIKVAEKLCDKYENVYFLLCGLGVKEGIENIVGVGNINSKIIMPGMRSDIPIVLRIMNAYYFPSITEGQPNALIEAMIVGLPFVASNIEPIKECVPINFQNCLVLPEDSNAAIEKLSTYIESRSQIDFQEIKTFAQSEFMADVKFNQFLKEL